MRVIVLALALLCVASATTYFQEQFNSGWDKRESRCSLLFLCWARAGMNTTRSLLLHIFPRRARRAAACEGCSLFSLCHQRCARSAPGVRIVDACAQAVWRMFALCEGGSGLWRAASARQAPQPGLMGSSWLGFVCPCVDLAFALGCVLAEGERVVFLLSLEKSECVSHARAQVG